MYKTTQTHFEFVHDYNLKLKPIQVAIDALNAMFAIAEREGINSWFAHNGGKYDVCFILQAITKMGLQASGHLAAGRMVTLKIKRGDTTIALYDSMAIIPGALKKIAKSFNLKSQKLLGDDDYSVDVRQWSFDRMKEGCRADCEVVLEALDVIETLIEHEGGELKPTFSSCAFSVVKSKTELPDTRKWIAENKVARMAYMGGRVEVYQHTPKAMLGEWDVNSSYPWSMSQPDLPWILKGMVFGDKAKKAFESNSACIVECTVNVPDCYLPVLPFRHPDGGMYFPVGKWRGFFVVEEIRYAESIGLAKIVSVHSAIEYTKETPFKEFIEEFYRLKSTTDGASRNFYKLILNGCYGKFAQKPEKELLRIFPDQESAFDFMVDREPDTVRVVSNSDLRFLSVQHYLWSKHTHYALAATITARSRILLHKHLSASTGVAYTDTDSIHASSDSRFSDGSIGDGLGQLKQEIRQMAGYYYAPKIYALIPVDGEPKYASKGFHVDAKTFDSVIKGEKVSAKRMQLVKRQIANGNTPTRIEETKSWSGISAKRIPLNDSPNGDTLPWHVSDLLENAHLLAKSPAIRF